MSIKSEERLIRYSLKHNKVIEVITGITSVAQTMKKLLILLLLPLFSFSQTYKDVMSIKDVDTFKKVAIENNYEFDQINDEGWIDYGFNIQKDS